VYLALVLVVVAAVAVVLYDHHDLRAWTPNIATSALSIAITVTIVSWIVRREARRRIQPRVERTLYWIGLGYRGFLHAILIDYAGTHHATFLAADWRASDGPCLSRRPANTSGSLRITAPVTWTCWSRTWSGPLTTSDGT
jgi:hypothetical protein